ncbi:uncharacterized protein LOC129731384 [Wyeomyia smithii]|uniref:uncharacterized protein LOC129731384 n=1 Tax=Wyeomyia smithii TaxID=174621 RepID=UPI002467EF49|nr:uncharacterized protein LOC129731384 [Wyeomyia smithii]
MSKQKWKNSKQYCAKPECDPYDLWYQQSNVFSDYMNDAPCQIPKVEAHLADPIELVETIDSIDLPAHRLTGKVRNHYLNYLENLLARNYKTWSDTIDSLDNVMFTSSEIKRCAESIELKAVKSCMIVSLYRSYILNIITQIRKETNELNLHSHLINMKFTPKFVKKELCSVAVQTEPSVSGPCHLESSIMEVNGEVPLYDTSLDEKIRHFKKKLHFNEPNTLSCKKRRKDQRKKINKDDRRLAATDRIDKRKSKLSATRENSNQLYEDVQPVTSNICSAEPILDRNDSNDDQIMRELEAMFEMEDNGNIFDSCENQVQIKAIINEIEQFDPPNLDKKDGMLASRDDHLPSPRLKQSLNDKHSFTVPKKVLENTEAHVEDLKKSLWLCELHMQKMRLRDLLSNIADNNYFRYERIQARFIVLFGDFEHEEDELGPYSPSIELNDVLVASCRQRIAKWVVQALMKPLNDGLIGNRFLFKKLAKHIADGIIFQNQYPDQQFIKNYVLDYFCAHRAVLSIEDMI